MRLSFTQSGSFKNLEKFLASSSKSQILSTLNRLGQQGVVALSNATPAESGFTSMMWEYQVTSKNGVYEIFWTNGNVVDGIPVVILLQYGHGTGTGGYVRGRDFINPAIRPVFDRIANEVWRVVTSA